MKFTKFTFLMLGVAAMVFLVSVNAKAACTASAGQFCKASSRHDCRPKCYCTGGSNTNTGMDIERACSERWNAINDLVDTGIHLCPSNFPYSDEGASSAQDCYAFWIVENEFRIVYNRKINCPAGMFIQSGFPWCMGCKDNENVKSTEYCPGVEDFPSRTENYRKGVSACTGKVSDDKKTCMEISKNCPAGSYMPANSQQCSTPCPNGYVCLGGNYEVDYPTDQGKLLPKDACTSEHGFDDEHYVANGYGDGCDKCPIGTKANADHTECVETSIKVTKGYYLPANSVQQQKCSNPKKFCPGGEFWKSSVEQGQYDCPFTGTSASSNYQRCTVTLSEEQLQFGVMGNNGSQCWSKTDPEDFQYCVLGLRGIKTIPALSTATANSIKKITLESINSARTH